MRSALSKTQGGNLQAVRGWGVVGALLLLGVLLPFVLFEAPMERLTQMALSAEVGPWGKGAAVAILLAIDLILPIPSSLVATSAGQLLGPVGGTLATWIGLSVGAGVGYGVGRCAEPFASRRVGPAALAQAQAFMARYGLWGVVLCRPVPVLAETTAVLAGVHRLPPRAFALLVGGANLGISLTYAVIGAAAPEGASVVWVLGGAVGVPLIATGIARILAP